MDTIEKLHAIQAAKIIYNILYRAAGVGFLFYTPLPPEAGTPGYMPPENWQQGLSVDHYYPTFEEAVDAEYARLGL